MNAHLTIKCTRVRYTPEVSVFKSREYQKAFYGGLIVCANPWACPVCAPKIQERRRAEIAQGIDWAYKSGLKAVMVTFTFPHAFKDNLKGLLDKQKEAFRLLRSGKAWQKIKDKIGFEGLIRSLEIVHGQNGWHPHTHELWFVNKDADVEALKAKVLERWYNICLKVGLTTEDKNIAFMLHAVDVKDNASNSDYLAKQDSGKYWGADREVAKSSSKGKSAGRHPFSLLEDYEQGDKRAGELFVEYALAVKGKAQIFWTHGLKAKAGLIEKTDEEITEEKDDLSYLLGLLSESDWSTAVYNRLRAKVLEVAESEGFAAVLIMLEKVRSENIKQWKQHGVLNI